MTVKSIINNNDLERVSGGGGQRALRWIETETSNFGVDGKANRRQQAAEREPK